MTSRNEDTEAQPAEIADLLILHRYARSRYFGETKSSRKAASELDMTSDGIKGVWNRLEKEFGTYIVAKRAMLNRNERSEDLQCAGEWDAFRRNRLDAWNQDQKSDAGERTPANGKGPNPPEYTLTNKMRLTLAGEIFGEVASILAGYLSVARRATKARKEDGLLEHPADLHRVLGWLQNERRRLHRIVSATRQADCSVFDLGMHLPDDHFDEKQRDKSDVLDMVECRLPAYDPSHESEEDPPNDEQGTPKPEPVVSTSVPRKPGTPPFRFRPSGKGVA